MHLRAEHPVRKIRQLSTKAKMLITNKPSLDPLCGDSAQAHGLPGYQDAWKTQRQSVGDVRQSGDQRLLHLLTR